MSKKTDPPECPNAIRRYRKMRHFKLKEVALLMGLKSASHISHWEKGRKLPSLINCFKLAAVIKCTPDILFNELYKQIQSEIHRRKVKYNVFEKYD